MPIHSRPVEPVTRLFSPECHIRGKGSGYGKPGGHPLISRFSRKENSFSSFPVSPDFSRGPATSSPQRSPGPCAYPFKKLSFHLQFIFGLRLYTSHRQLDKACLYRNLKTCHTGGIIQLRVGVVPKCRHSPFGGKKNLTLSRFRYPVSCVGATDKSPLRLIINKGAVTSASFLDNPTV